MKTTIVDYIVKEEFQRGSERREVEERIDSIKREKDFYEDLVLEKRIGE